MVTDRSPASSEESQEKFSQQSESFLRGVCVLDSSKADRRGNLGVLDREVFGFQTKQSPAGGLISGRHFHAKASSSILSCLVLLL